MADLLFGLVAYVTANLKQEIICCKKARRDAFSKSEGIKMLLLLSLSSLVSAAQHKHTLRECSFYECDAGEMVPYIAAKETDLGKR